MQALSIGVVSQQVESRRRAQQLAEQLRIPFAEPAETFELLLVVTQQRLELRQTHTNSSVYVDFVNGALAHRRRFGGGRNQPLARAIGMKPGFNPSIIDATAGLGRDAYILASLGCEVILCERSPILAVLLEDGLLRAANSRDTAAAAERMTLIKEDAINYLKQSAVLPDSIYLDPMFPQKKSSALVKKDMQILQLLIGADMDSGQLFNAAMSQAGKRVVVKRPASAKPLDQTRPAGSVCSKKTRYDIYAVTNP
ncbi:MAG: class I SAM-dependent methyltransferase [Gammaproteobacteria bacterium]